MKPNKSGPFIIMKTLRNSTNTFVDLLSKSIRDFRKSYIDEINDIKIDLLRKISDDYGISLDELLYKYARKTKNGSTVNVDTNEDIDDEYDPTCVIDTYKDKESLFLNSTHRAERDKESLGINTTHRAEQNKENFISSIDANENVNKQLLYKVIISNDIFYVENKEDGIIYDIESNNVGKYINGKLEINMELMRKYRIERKNRKYGLYVNNFIKEYEEKIRIEY